MEDSLLSKAESENVIEFLNCVFSRHGIQEIIIIVNGPQFTSDKTKAFLDKNNVNVRYLLLIDK
jgi:hypothetical protein